MDVAANFKKSSKTFYTYAFIEMEIDVRVVKMLGVILWSEVLWKVYDK